LAATGTSPPIPSSSPAQLDPRVRAAIIDRSCFPRHMMITHTDLRKSLATSPTPTHVLHSAAICAVSSERDQRAGGCRRQTHTTPTRARSASNRRRAHGRVEPVWSSARGASALLRRGPDDRPCATLGLFKLRATRPRPSLAAVRVRFETRRGHARACEHGNRVGIRDRGWHPLAIDGGRRVTDRPVGPAVRVSLTARGAAVEWVDRAARHRRSAIGLAFGQQGLAVRP
jgi:hypothetical protein